MAATVTEHRTACPLDCPDTCSLTVTVRDGRIERVDAAPIGEGNPLTQGFICKKVKHHARRVHGPDRVLHPLVRSGPKGSGSFEVATWDEALDLVASRIRTAIDERGPDAVIPYLYNSSAGVLARGSAAPLFAARLGLPDVEHTICAGTATAAWEQVFGEMLSADPLDVPHARLVVVWGANPTVSNTHLLPLLTEMRGAGGTLVVIDPRRTGVADRSDLHLAVRPGTDVVLAYALVRIAAERGTIDREFCERHVEGVDEYLAAAAEWTPARAADVCGVDVESIERLAELLGSVRPALLRIGWGLERNRNGGSGIVAALSTWALHGHFGQRGSGVLGSTGGALPLDMRRLSPAGESPTRRSLSMNDVGRLLCGGLGGWETPSVLFVQGANPANTAVDQGTMLRGLGRDDVFTVVHDQVMTDTAALADVVLPATTHFEAHDVAASYGSFTLQEMPAIIDRVGESRTNDEVIVALAERIGIVGLVDDPGVALGRVVTDGAPVGERRLRPEGGTVQFVDTFPTTPNRRVRVHAPDSELPLPRYAELRSDLPLTLISPASSKLVNSMFGEFDAPEAAISMHPDDAAARGLVGGTTVRVANEQGELRLPLRVDASLRPGVCLIPKGIWLRDYPAGRGVNLLVPPASSDLAAGACFNDTRVEVSGET